MEIKKNPGCKIAVSILNCDFMNLRQEIKRIEEAGAGILHVDIMDGDFAPNFSIGPSILKSIRANTELFLDVHLMIKNPERHIDTFIESGADLINVHVEECRHLDRTLNYIKNAGVNAAVALNPATPLCFVENVFQYLDMILIMTVNPGFGGQKFINEMTYKIQKLREMIKNNENYTGKIKDIDIQVDGGVNEETAPKAVMAGASVVVLGTAFFNAPDPRDLVNHIKQGLVV